MVNLREPPSTFHGNLDVEACELTTRRTPLGATIAGRSQASPPRKLATATRRSPPHTASDAAALVRSQGCEPAHPAGPAGGQKGSPVQARKTGYRADEAGADVARPGTSNTRALLPSGSESLDAAGTTHEQNPTLLQCRVDAFNLAYRVAISRQQRLNLDEGLRLAGVSGTGVEFGVAGVAFKLQENGTREKQYRLVNTDATILAGDDRNGFCVVVEFRALYLATHSLDETVQLARRFAVAVAGAEPDEKRVRRLDLCADATVSFSAADTGAFIARPRKAVQFHAKSVHTKRSRGQVQYTGFTISPGNPLQARLYDKLEELRTQHAEDAEKRVMELEAYRAKGWNGTGPVWRLELQIRGSALDELGLRDPGGAAAKLDQVWAYAFAGNGQSGRGAWCRLCVPGSAQRRHRWQVDHRWRVFQRADFGTAVRSPLQRSTGSRGGASLTQVLGSLRSYLAAQRRLPSAGDGPEQTLRGDLRAVLDAALAEPGLAEMHCARRSAAAAAFSSVDDGATAPDGLGRDVVDFGEEFDHAAQ